MPELPEVEVTRLGIAGQLVGHRISTVVVREPRLRWPVSAEVSTLAGRTVRAIERRGKYLLLDCGDGHLIVHLGMSGSLRVVGTDVPPGPHDRVDIAFGGRVLRLRDPRRFGAVLWAAGNPLLHPLLAHLGVEPLSDAFDGDRLHAITRKHRSAIKVMLMDAKEIVGIGNIYASESLFRARIRPTTSARRLSLERCERLAREIRQTLRAAIRAGGSSLRDYVGTQGEPGYFQQRYGVYGRDGQPCRVCGTAIRRIVQGQRSTFYCPRCQR
ncbi:MAG: bifunctional DNA-formamidopyrimidine glycosylase/DNA-(apurinic or apyrimidinic site) lyase [Burkholderiales bacterium]